MTLSLSNAGIMIILNNHVSWSLRLFEIVQKNIFNVALVQIPHLVFALTKSFVSIFFLFCQFHFRSPFALFESENLQEYHN